MRHRVVAAEPNDVLTDEAYIVDSLHPDLDGDGAEAEAIIETDTPRQRTTRLRISNHMDLNLGGETRINVLVNGTPAALNQVVLATETDLLLYLVPGRNAVIVQVVQAHPTAASNGRHTNIELDWVDARNADRSKRFFGDLGQSLSLTVFTPPAL